jgi:hypothetical protein
LRGFHGGDYEECRVLDVTPWFLQEPHGVTSQETESFITVVRLEVFKAVTMHNGVR